MAYAIAVVLVIAIVVLISILVANRNKFKNKHHDYYIVQLGYDEKAQETFTVIGKYYIPETSIDDVLQAVAAGVPKVPNKSMKFIMLRVDLYATK